MSADKRLFCFGYGYTCEYLAQALAAQGGWSIAGTTRDREKKEDLRSRNIESFLFDYEHPLGDPLYILQDTTHLLISTPPDADGDIAYRLHAEDIIRIPTLEWVGYLSTTGVYGDRGGEWVDETSDVNPTTIRGSRRAKAEEQWMTLFESYNLPLHIFRLAGIYGPGRSALDSVRAGIGRRIDKPGQAFSRTHVEDIVQVLMASMANPAPGRAYNVCDDEPAPSHEVIAEACALLGQEPPPLVPFEEANLAPIAMSFYTDNKRVRNDRIKQELGVQLRYPDYRKGLRGCFDAEEQAGIVA